MPTPVDYLVANSFFGLAKETTWNTPVAAAAWVPIMQPKWTPKVKWLPDTSLVGSPVVTRDLVPGKRFDEFSFKHNLYMDTIGHELVAILGADVVTGTGPFVHTVKVINNQTGSQAPSYTLGYFDGGQGRQLAGSKAASLAFSWSADGAIEVTDTWICSPETDQTISNTPSSAVMPPGWDIAISINAVSSTIMVSGSLDITRGTEAIFTSDASQNPHFVFNGPIQAKGKAKFLVESGGFNPFTGGALVRNQQPVVLTFTEPVSTSSLALTMTACQFSAPVLDPGSKWLQVEVEFEGVADSTDASSGISPIKAVLTNTQAAQY